jgi:hypothetical protein
LILIFGTSSKNSWTVIQSLTGLVVSISPSKIPWHVRQKESKAFLMRGKFISEGNILSSFSTLFKSWFFLLWANSSKSPKSSHQQISFSSS